MKIVTCFCPTNKCTHTSLLLMTFAAWHEVIIRAGNDDYSGGRGVN